MYGAFERDQSLFVTVRIVRENPERLGKEEVKDLKVGEYTLEGSINCAMINFQVYQ